MSRRVCGVVVSGLGRPPKTLSLEVADTPVRRARGLMGRTSWDGSDGMLFVYPWPRVTGIWMAGTHLALDAVFVDSKGRIIKIAHDLAPLTRHAEYSGARVKWVMEVPAGSCREMGLTVGDRVEVVRGSERPGLLGWLMGLPGRLTRSG